jgi:hypothetical protein
VHELGTLPDGRPFLAMKLVKGRTLQQLLEEGPSLTVGAQASEKNATDLSRDRQGAVPPDRGHFLAIFEWLKLRGRVALLRRHNQVRWSGFVAHLARPNRIDDSESSDGTGPDGSRHLLRWLSQAALAEAPAFWISRTDGALPMTPLSKVIDTVELRANNVLRAGLRFLR